MKIEKEVILSCGAIVRAESHGEVHFKLENPYGMYGTPIRRSDCEYQYSIREGCIILTVPSDCDKLIEILREVKDSLLARNYK